MGALRKLGVVIGAELVLLSKFVKEGKRRKLGAMLLFESAVIYSYVQGYISGYDAGSEERGGAADPIDIDIDGDAPEA